VIIGGQNLVGTQDDTVYVPYLNINDLGANTSVNNLGIDVSGNVVVGQGSTNNFAVDGLLAEGQPYPIFTISPNPANLSATSLLSGQTQTPTVIYDDFSAYNSLSGVWTCPLNGRYNLSFFIHLSDPLYGWQNPSSTPPFQVVSSAIVSGVVNQITNEVYAANNFYPSVPQLYADINGAQWGVELVAGDQLCLRIINTSGVNYSPQTGDYVRFSIQKIG
jgi:hypothetical protein